LQCAEHIYRPWPFSKKTRWNNRNPGNGRYPGHGIVRRFNSNSIHVNLHTPTLYAKFTNETAALEAIQVAVQS
jgi:hypothetical protein